MTFSGVALIHFAAVFLSGCSTPKFYSPKQALLCKHCINVFNGEKTFTAFAVKVKTHPTAGTVTGASLDF